MTGLLVLLLVAGTVAPATAEPVFKSGMLAPPRAAPDFLLKTPDGRAFQLSRQRGRVVALVFGYTFCPDVCPTTLAELAAVKKQLGTDGSRLAVVFVTVDPERDGPERLRSYTGAFDHTFIGLTGSANELAEIRRGYGVTARKHVVSGTAAAYLIDHSAFVYVIDPGGQLRLMFPFGTAIDDMAHDIRLLMRR